MSEAINSKACERGEDLISFIYSELDDYQARDFDQHRQKCANCQSELASLGFVRESLIAWRDRSLGRTASPLLVPTVNDAREQNPSAWTAIRTFFELSPLWLKGMTAFAAILLCVLSGMVVSRWVNNPEIQPTIVKAEKSAEELEAEIQRRVRLELSAAKSHEQATPVVKDMKVSRNGGSTGARNVAFVGHVPQRLRKPLTRSEREQLAADLRLTSTDTEDSLQLLGDRINRED